MGIYGNEAINIEIGENMFRFKKKKNRDSFGPRNTLGSLWMAMVAGRKADANRVFGHKAGMEALEVTIAAKIWGSGLDGLCLSTENWVTP